MTLEPLTAEQSDALRESAAQTADRALEWMAYMVGRTLMDAGLDGHPEASRAAAAAVVDALGQAFMDPGTHGLDADSLARKAPWSIEAQR